MEAIDLHSSETLVITYKTTRFHNPKYHNPNFHRHENSKSHALINLLIPENRTNFLIKMSLLHGVILSASVFSTSTLTYWFWLCSVRLGLCNGTAKQVVADQITFCTAEVYAFALLILCVLRRNVNLDCSTERSMRRAFYTNSTLISMKSSRATGRVSYGQKPQWAFVHNGLFPEKTSSSSFAVKASSLVH
jgi:hypothetical protein